MTEKFVRLAMLLLVVFSMSAASPVLCRESDSLADAVLAEINLARTTPRAYANFIRQLRGRYHGTYLRPPGSEAQIKTTEGIAAVDEAIRFLTRQKPVPPLAASKGLSQAAAELVEDEGSSGDVGHTGSHSGGPRSRVERHGRWQGRMGENIYYGPGQARLVVMQLIIDDGVPDRGHRKNIFETSFHRAGVACGPPPQVREHVRHRLCQPVQ